MCFYNSMSAKAVKLAARYGRKSDVVEIYKEILNEKKRNGESVLDFPEDAYIISAFPKKINGVDQYKSYPIITTDNEIQVMQWGLIPFWTKSELDADKIRKGTYNAKSETIHEKPSFRGPIRSQRCIIPSTGYFEYHHNLDGSTTPYFIYLENDPIFSMAGVYDHWVNPETGKEELTFSMITTDANELTGRIHNGGKNPHRMPLILRKEDENIWLDPDLTKKNIESLLSVFPADLMEAYPIDHSFTKKDQHDKSIIEKAEK